MCFLQNNAIVVVANKLDERQRACEAEERQRRRPHQRPWEKRWLFEELDVEDRPHSAHSLWFFQLFSQKA